MVRVPLAHLALALQLALLPLAPEEYEVNRSLVLFRSIGDCYLASGDFLPVFGLI
jgi:hypothetical protein